MPVANNVYFGADHWVAGGSDAYNGDKACNTLMPLACVGYSADRRCETITSTNQRYCLCVQSGAYALDLKFTTPIPGYWMSSVAHGDALCKCFFGNLYRMARFHDAGAWGMFAYSEDGWGTNVGARAWIAINDQNANCWGMGASPVAPFTQGLMSCGPLPPPPPPPPASVCCQPSFVVGTDCYTCPDSHPHRTYTLPVKCSTCPSRRLDSNSRELAGACTLTDPISVTPVVAGTVEQDCSGGGGGGCTEI